MARTRQEPATIEHDDEQRALDLIPTLQEGELQLDSVLASLGDSDEKARVMLYRVGKNGEKDKYLRKFTPQEWLDYGQDGVLYDYGGGSYRVRVYDKNSKLRANTGIELEEPRTARGPTPPYPSRLGEVAHVAAPAPAPQGADVLTAVNAMMQAMQATITQAFDKLGAAMQVQPKREDFLRELVQYKTLFAAQPAPVAPVVQSPEPLDVFMKAVSFVKENLSPREGNGETGPADVFLELARSFAPVIADQARLGALTQAGAPTARSAGPSAPTRAVQPGPPLVSTAGTPVRTATAASSAPSVERPSEGADVDFQMKMAVGFLVNQARNESDPQTYAELVLDTVDPTVIEQWRAQPSDALIEWLAGYDPEVRKFSVWFKQVHAEIVAILADESAAPEPGANADPLLTAVSGASITGNTGEVD
jgi:hypothetical protein